MLNAVPQVVRQQELLYNVEFQLQQMERKVARAGGVRSEEETKALNARIERLTGRGQGAWGPQAQMTRTSMGGAEQQLGGGLAAQQ